MSTGTYVIDSSYNQQLPSSIKHPLSNKQSPMSVIVVVFLIEQFVQKAKAPGLEISACPLANASIRKALGEYKLIIDHMPLWQV